MGCGLVGKHIALDLAEAFDVTVADQSPERLQAAFAGTRISTLNADLSQPDVLGTLVSRFDLAVGALPGRLGRSCLQTVLDAGRNLVDIAFFPEDAFELDALARSHNCTAVIDMGLAPGLSNLLLGRAVATLASVQRFECLVGGLPVERKWPFEYKAPFSPADVLEEYTRPARLVEGGIQVQRPALSEPELVDFPGIGTLEAFNTDGLRTLLRTYPHIPFMKEKTLRYPGHARLMQALRDTGFLSPLPIPVRGCSVAPLDVTSALLFPQWQLGEEEPEFTVMRVDVEGRTREGAAAHLRWDLLDRFDPVRKVSSMARTTGYTCAAAVHLLVRGLIPGPGVVPPEKIGEIPACYNFILSYLRERSVVLMETGSLPAGRDRN
ncbi:MAG: saccharopine dehydrogenase family protein [Acidobacteriota bacterium]